MRLRGQFFGAMSLAIATIACAAANAGGTGVSAADERVHHHAAPDPDANRRIVSYPIPNIRLTRQDGTVVNFGDELNDGRPVVLSFIYTSCTAVCPLVSHTLAQLQSKLGDYRDHVHLMSVTIDPEQDDPARLREYARTFNAGPEWQHYTGTLAASQAVQRAFDVYRGGKMQHVPATMIRPAPGAPWIRLEGFATADQMLAELPTFPELHAAR